MKTTVMNLILLFLLLIITNNLFSQNKPLDENILISGHLQNNLIGSPFLISPNKSCYLLYKNDFYIRNEGVGDSWGQIIKDVNAISIDPKNPNIFYAIYYGWKYDNRSGKKTVIEKSMDGGNNWIRIENGLSNGLNPIKFLINPHNNSEVFLMTTTGIYKTSDAGFSWQLFKTENGGCEFVINSLDKNKYYVHTFEGIEISSDAGQSWKIISNTLPKILVKGKGRTAKYKTVSIFCFVVADYPNSSFLLLDTEKGMFKSTNEGESWIEVNDGFSPIDKIFTFFFYNNEILLGGGELNKTTNKFEPIIYKTDTNASKWKRIKIVSNELQYIDGIYRDDSHSGIFIKSNDKIAYVDTNQNIIGLNYGVMPHSKIISFNHDIINGHCRIYCYLSNNNYTDIDNNGLFNSDDNGLRWVKSLIKEINEPTIYISPHDSKEIRMIEKGEWANTYLTSDGGISWSNYKLTMMYSNDIVFDFIYDPIDKNIYYACNGVNESKLYKYKFNKSSNDNKWIPLNINARNIKVNIDDNNKLLTNNLDFSTDGGWTWNSLKGNNQITNSDEYGTHTRVLYFKGKYIMLLINNSLVISDDEGKNWNVQKSFNGKVKSISINPRDSNNIVVIIEEYKDESFQGISVLQTDNGAIWYLVANSSYKDSEDYYRGAHIVYDSNKKVIYLFGDAGLFYSIDNGKNWKKLGGIHENI